jgi:hypothetical protein
MDIALTWAGALTVAMLALLAACGIDLWRTTHFRCVESQPLGACGGRKC